LLGGGSLHGRIRGGISNHGALLQLLGDGDAFGESLHGVLAFKLLELWGSVLVKELVNGQVATTDTDINLFLVDTNVHSLGSELVDTLGFSNEEDLQLLSVGVVVNVLGNTLVNHIILGRDVHGDSRLKINDVVLEALDLSFEFLVASGEFLKFGQELKRLALGHVELFLELQDVCRSLGKFLLEDNLGEANLLFRLSGDDKLLLNILESGEGGL